MARSNGNHKILPDPGITFDDVLLLPGYTDFSRKQVDLSVALHPSIMLKLPVISAPMDTVTEAEMATMMAMHGGIGILHRNLSITEQSYMVRAVK